MKRQSDSWVEVVIYAIWAIAAVVLVLGAYVAVHFIAKFW